jgi:serine/threonine protein kinase
MEVIIAPPAPASGAHCACRCGADRGPSDMVSCPGCAPTVQTVIRKPFPPGQQSPSHPFGVLPEGFSKRFTIEKVLGRGSTGIVLQAVHIASSRRVAVKLLKWPIHPTGRARLHLEGTMLAHLRHPRIVRLLAIHRGPCPYLVLEHMSGGTLKGLMSERRQIPMAEALSLILDCLEGLENCHALGVVHRDLKPCNILLTRAGRPKLADFGIAQLRSVPSEMTSGRAVGTPRYMAPEQARGEEVSPASDLYSLCLILYEMLVGQSVFDEEDTATAGTATESHLANAIARLSQVAPSALCAIVEQTLSLKASERPSSASRLAGQLRAILKN